MSLTFEKNISIAGYKKSVNKLSFELIEYIERLFDKDIEPYQTCHLYFHHVNRIEIILTFKFPNHYIFRHILWSLFSTCDHTTFSDKFSKFLHLRGIKRNSASSNDFIFFEDSKKGYLLSTSLLRRMTIEEINDNIESP